MECANQCCKCKNFDRYYVRAVKKFDKTEIGRCFETGENVNAYDGCDKFVPKDNRKKVNNSVAVSLSNLLTELSSLRNIIEEEIRDQ